MSRSNVQIDYDDGTLTITVHPKFESAAVHFRDGSLGFEFGPENGRCLTRRVEWPKGGEPNIERASRTDWDECAAAKWVEEARSGWTMVDEVQLHSEDLRAAGIDLGGLDEGAMARVDGVVEHE